jgi:rRNA maturation RNase YbeY
MTSTLKPSRIQFHFLEKGITLRDRNLLKAYLEGLYKKEKRKLEQCNYVFCSDDYLLEINRQYLKHDYYTDIITFDLSEPNTPLNAEIYISVDRVRDNARQFNTSIHQELHRVIFHGALHLCGYKDKTTKEEELMRKMEDKYLKGYFK